MMTLLFGIKDVIWRPFCFQNNSNFPIHLHFVKSDEASRNILGYTEQTLRPENFKSVAMENSCRWISPKNLIRSRSSWGKHILKIW